MQSEGIRCVVGFGKWQGCAIGAGIQGGAAAVVTVCAGGYRVGFCEFREHAVGAVLDAAVYWRKSWLCI